MKKFLAIMVAAIMLAGLSACGNLRGSKNYESNTELIAVPGTDDLYYDSRTKVVYFVFNEYAGYQGYGYMSAYYAPNGLPYLYDPFNQELVEISHTQTEQEGCQQPILVYQNGSVQ